MRASRYGTLFGMMATFASVACSGSGVEPIAHYAVALKAGLGAGRGAGSLDPRFGKHGRVLVAIDSTPVAAATTNDSRIVILGNSGTPGSADVVRLLRNGRLDESFGNEGVVALHMFAAYSLTVAPGGELIVGGVAPDQTHAELIRLRADGTLDSSFGSDGVVDFDYTAGTSNGTFVTILQPDGNLVAGGFALSLGSDVELTSLARFDSRGNLDATFGSGGIVSVNLVGAVTAIGLQSNGDILVCGGPLDPSASLLVRFLPDGTVDQNDEGGRLKRFAHTGSLTFEGSNAFDSRGRLLRWASASESSAQYVSVVRLLRNEMPDPHFDGKPFAFGSTDVNVPRDVELAQDGTMLIAGEGSSSTGKRVFGVARLLRGGTLDPSFGKDGRVITPLEYAAQATALAIEPDGKIVVAGVAIDNHAATSLAVTRYLAK
jgi:uncharacterized delta-60 repeat protein